MAASQLLESSIVILHHSKQQYAAGWPGGGFPGRIQYLLHSQLRCSGVDVHTGSATRKATCLAKA